MLETLPALIKRLNIDPRVVAYYTGFIAINIVICIIPIVDLIELTQLAKLGRIGLELFEVVLKVVGKTGKIVATSVEQLFGLFDTLMQILQKGTEELINFIKKVFKAIEEWVVGVKGKVIPINENSRVDELFRLLKKKFNPLTGDEILSISTIKLLKRELEEKFGVILKIVDKDPKLKSKLKDWNSRFTKPAASFSVKERTIFIRSRVSAYTVEHELYHMKLWYKMTQEFPELIEQYKALNQLQHEEYVLAQFMKDFNKWNIKDLEIDLQTINWLRRNKYNLPEVDLNYFKNWVLPK